MAFETRNDGVYWKSLDPKRPALWLCSRLEVVAFVRDGASEKWSRLLRFNDPDGVVHEVPLAMSMLADNGHSYRRMLASKGLDISSDRQARELLTEFIRGEQPGIRVLSVSRPGWHDGVFVLPDVTIGNEGSQAVIWQAQSAPEYTRNGGGSLEDWRNTIGKPCSGNTRLLFAVSSAFAAPLLSVVGEESGGFHFRGRSSLGKTTALLVAGSVWGGGGRTGYVESWLTTVNGLEATAELHNDGLLCLDELSRVAAEEAGKTAYLLANGQGKGRMDKHTALRKRLKWTLLFLSSGELSLHDHMKSVGKGTRAGQHVRLVEIAADAERGMGLFEDIHQHKSADAFSRSLTQATLKYYGTPIREFLRLLIHEYRLYESEEIEGYLRFQVSDFTSQYCPDGAPGEVSRVVGRFALVAAAGELATMLEITGWAEGEATAAAAACFQSWLLCRGTRGSSDDEMAVKQVRAFIEAHGSSRFQAGKEPVPNRAGFVRTRKGGDIEYWILSEVFHREVCDGFDSSMVAKALAERKHLRRSKDRIEVKVRIPGGTIWVYAIKASILTF